MKTRESVFAGSWYPASAAGCEKEIHRFLDEYDTSALSGRSLKGGIVPHAGWYFSGSIACNVIHLLKDEHPVDVIAVFGMHLHPSSSRFLMTEGAWETPFGDLEIESRIAKKLTEKYSFTVETPMDFTQDNTIELQLPFIKYFFKDTKIIPMGVPPTDSSLDIGRYAVDTAKALGLRMKVVGSTDMTHYGSNYGFSPAGSGKNALDWVRSENDRKSIDAMLAMNPEAVIKEALANHNTCCSGAAAAAIAAATALGAEKAEKVAYATSYDKSPGESFVGYVGVVFE